MTKEWPSASEDMPGDSGQLGHPDLCCYGQNPLPAPPESTINNCVQGDCRRAELIAYDTVFRLSAMRTHGTSFAVQP